MPSDRRGRRNGVGAGAGSRGAKGSGVAGVDACGWAFMAANAARSSCSSAWLGADVAGVPLAMAVAVGVAGAGTCSGGAGAASEAIWTSGQGAGTASGFTLAAPAAARAFAEVEDVLGSVTLRRLVVSLPPMAAS